MSKSLIVSLTFLRSLLPLQRYQVFKFLLPKVGQDHIVQFSRLHLKSNGHSAIIVLRDLDILVEDKNK